MANDYFSIPVHMEIGTRVAYTCPANKKAIIKAIVITNQSGISGAVTVKWTENNTVGVGFPTLTNVYPVMTSGLVPGFGRVRAIDDFLVIKNTDVITVHANPVQCLNVLFSIIEQDITS